MDKLAKYRQIVCQYLEDFAREDPEAKLIFDLERDRFLNGAMCASVSARDFASKRGCVASSRCNRPNALHRYSFSHACQLA